MPRRPPFDPAATYVVRRGFSHQGRLMRTGEPFDVTIMRPHAARILYNAGRLSMAPHAPVVVKDDDAPLFLDVVPGAVRKAPSPQPAILAKGKR